MQTGWLVLAAMVLGIVVGVAATVTVVLAHRRGQRAAAVIAPSVPDGVEEVIEALETVGIVLDASNNVVKASASALGYGLVWNQRIVHPEIANLVDQVRRDGEPVVRELQLSRGPFGDAALYVVVRVARIGARYVLVLAEDRTEWHRVEDVRRDFVANVSHELKTPIGAISLLGEAIASAADEPDEVRRFAERLRIESDRLARLTQEILELSRLQSGAAPTDPRLVELDDVIARAIDQNQVVAEAHRIQLVPGGQKGTQVFGDEAMLTRALHNLIANAIQHSPDGARVGIGVSLSNGAVEIAVTDNGAGIPDSDRDRVFERFFRVDAARSRNTGGTGLGLSIVKHVVQNHGGDVRVWSKLGSGSTFTIRLPEASGAPAIRGGVTA